MIKTGTTRIQGEELVKLGLDESSSDIHITVKQIKGDQTELTTIKSWSFTKLMSFIPCDKDHKWNMSGVDGEKCKISLSSTTDKYKKTVEADCLVDCAYEAVIYLLKKGILKK